MRRFTAHPESAPGDFYVVNRECASCGAPHAVAPDLISWAEGTSSHCIWKKQPETPEEWEQAFAAFDVSEIGCYRYAGNDPTIMNRIGLDYCDHPRTRPKESERRVVDSGSPVEVQFLLLASEHESKLSRLIKSLVWLVSKLKRP